MNEDVGKKPDKTRAPADKTRPGKQKCKAGNGKPEKSLKTEIRIGNAHNIGARESQQDSFGISDISNEGQRKEKGILAVVADGMGGLSNGAAVSAFVTSYMLGYFSKMPLDADISKSLLDMTIGVNMEVVRYLADSGSLQSGSTMAAAVIKDRTLWFVSVGDSRIYLQRGGALFQLNREHNYASELDEKAARCEISYEEAQNDPQRDALTSYIGMEELEKIDRNLNPIQLIAGDCILLMTDGVYRTVTEEEIRESVKRGAVKAASKLQNLIKSKNRPNQDNYTAVILECMRGQWQ